MGTLRPSGSPPAPPTSVRHGPSLATDRCPLTLPSERTVEGTGGSCCAAIGPPAPGFQTGCVISHSRGRLDGAVQTRGGAKALGAGGLIASGTSRDRSPFHIT